MKIASFGDYRVGVVDGSVIHDMTHILPDALDRLPSQRINYLVSNWAQLGPRMAEHATLGTPVPLDGVALLAANPAPRHVFAAPANYAKHIGELGSRAVTTGGRSAREQGFFLMAPGSLVGAGRAILLPRSSTRRFDHEAELAVIIGRRAVDVPRSEAMGYVFGYSCLVDVTLRIEKGVAEEERSMRKSFATFTPCGPFLVTADEIADPQALSNRLWVNGELRQEANTGEMIVGIAELIEMISSVLPLEPGDVIATGTPQGVGPIGLGDELRIEIAGVGSMTLPVRERDAVSPRPY